MQFTKRMWITMLAAVLLVAGGLSYFAVAADVEPYGVVRQCPECTESMEENIASRAGPYNGSHTYNGQVCRYRFMIVTFDYVCANGHHSYGGTYQMETAHSLCGK